MPTDPTPIAVARPTAERAAIARALARGGTIDITTHGRRTGLDRRLEIVFFTIEGRIFITGLPGRRGWYANLLADPTLTFHLPALGVDLPAHARPITDEPSRRHLLTIVTRAWRRERELDRFVAASPLIEVTFDEGDLLAA